MKALILCPFENYKRFITQNHLDPRNYKYISNAEHIHGFEDTFLLDLAGSFFPDAETWMAIKDYCASHNIDVLELY